MSGTSKPFSVMLTLAVFDFDITRSVVAWQTTAQSVVQVTNQGRMRYVRQCDSGGPATVTAGGNSLVANQIHRLVYAFNGTTVSAWIDTTLAINAQSADAGVAATLGTLRFGDGPTGTEDSFVGAITEIVICDHAVTSADVFGYQKWSTGAYGTGSVTPDITAPSYISSGSIAEGSNAIDVPFVSSPQADDVLFIQAVSRTPATLPAGLSGWNVFSTDTFASGRQQNVYWKRAVGGETGTKSIPLDTTSDSACAAMHLFRNVRRSSADAGISEASTESDASSGTFTGPTLAATATRRLAVAFFCSDENVSGPLTITGQSGGTWVHRFSGGSNLGSNCSIHLDTADMSGGGTLSGGSVSIGGSNGGSMRSTLLKGFYDFS